MARLRRDEAGSVTIWVAVSAAVLLALVGLALDLSREEITHTEAQAAADAAALAGAAQLDLSNGSCDRAKSAARTLVANRQKFAGSGGTITLSAVNCLSSLPPRDSTAIDTNPNDSPNNLATNDQNARFLQVITQQLTHNNQFLTVVGAPANAQVQTSAVAGMRQFICKVAPLMVCNPQETFPGAPFNGAGLIGVELRAKTQGSGGIMAPGVFGLLQTPLCPTNSASCVRDVLANASPNECFSDSVNVKPGDAAGPTNQGLNVRFDIYAGGVKQSSANPPDVNVTQRFNSCNKDTVQAGAAFPDDLSAPPALGLGNGQWNCQDYWTANHAQALPSWCTKTTSAPYTRYYVYQLEQQAQWASKYGQPRCVTPGVADRRILYLVVVNCRGSSVSANSSNVPALALLKTFLLRPVSQNGSDSEVDLEIEGIANPNDANSPLKDDVQLYR